MPFPSHTQEGPDVAYLVDELKTHLSQPIHVRGKGTAYEGLTRGSAAKSSQGRRVDLPFELKALEVCLDTVRDASWMGVVDADMSGVWIAFYIPCILCVQSIRICLHTV